MIAEATLSEAVPTASTPTEAASAAASSPAPSAMQRASTGNAGTLQAGAVTSGLSVDPRTSIALLVLVNILVLGGGPFILTLATAAFVAVLYLLCGRWRGALKFSVFILVCATVFLVLPRLVANPVTALVSVAAYWFTRFGVSCGYAAFFIATTGPAQIAAALVTLRFPRSVVVPLIVVIRFIPTVGQELRAINDAMLLRGIRPGALGAIMHPIRSSEFILVPLLAASSRIADDLSASSMLRGLGTHRHPTTIEALTFGTGDIFVCVCSLLLIALRIFGGGIIL
ncbi:MAG: energy-coupling factor transporter transmembrane component T [Bifidobacterium psychraerophilum]